MTSAHTKVTRMVAATLAVATLSFGCSDQTATEVPRETEPEPREAAGPISHPGAPGDLS